MTVSAGDDADAEDDNVTLKLVANGGGYINVSREVLVTVDDDETAGITVTPCLTDHQ